MPEQLKAIAEELIERGKRIEQASIQQLIDDRNRDRRLIRWMVVGIVILIVAVVSNVLVSNSNRQTLTNLKVTDEKVQELVDFVHTVQAQQPGQSGGQSATVTALMDKLNDIITRLGGDPAETNPPPPTTTTTEPPAPEPPTTEPAPSPTPTTQPNGGGVCSVARLPVVC